MPERHAPTQEDLILMRQFKMTDTGRVDRILDLYTTFNDKVDLEALKRGGYIRAVGEMMESVTMSLDDHAPEVIAYWPSAGWSRSSTARMSP